MKGEAPAKGCRNLWSWKRQDRVLLQLQREPALLTLACTQQDQPQTSEWAP